MSDWIDKLFNSVNDKATEETIEYALSLIDTSVYEEKRKTRLELNVFSMSAEEVGKLIEKLKDDQVCNIDAGMNYSATDIVDKLKQLK